MKGYVKWFKDIKGFGFITSSEGIDYFVHYSDIEGNGFKTLAENDEVSFDIRQGPKGLQATNVKLLK